MYAFVDRHPSVLGNGTRFVLWAMRGWAMARAKKSCPPRVLYRAFGGMGASAALPDFHVAMVLLHRDALSTLQLAEMNCCRIYEDEAVLLSLWHAAAREDGVAVGGTLACLVQAEAVQPVARIMTSCTTHLTLAGLDLAEALPTSIEE